MVFEGEYLNGKKHGKAREYWESGNNLSFEGKYLNGKAKEYDTSGILKFEGEYLNGEKMEKQKNIRRVN